MPAAPPAPIAPPPLAPGARVALVAPAGPLSADDVARAEANARAFGWEPAVGPHARGRHDYFAGTDADRLADLNAALASPRVDAVWCLRGGYGAMRLLDGVDYDALRRRPRALVGYSDVTALHLACAARAPGLVTFHGPTARAALTPFSRASLARALGATACGDGPAAGRADPCGAAPVARALRPGRAEGRLAGGNLALLAALCGTPYAPRFGGAVVVLEDVGEAIYRVDRMLRQLLLAGALAGCRALLFGHCTRCPEPCDDGAGGSDGRRTLAAVVAEAADALGVPAAVGVPVGHVDDQWTLPLGAHAEATVEDAGCALRVAWPAT